VPFGIELRVEQAGAAVPAEDRVVVTGGPDAVGLLISVHGFFQQDGNRVRWTSGLELGLGAAPMKEAGVVELLIGITELLKCFDGGRIRVGSISRELVGECKAESAQRKLMTGLDRKHILADGFSLFRFVQKSVEFSFCEGSVDSFG